MKTKQILIITFLLALVFFAKAQDPTLPNGESTIYLISGKTIKNVKLWKIDSLKIEFVKDGNLSEVRTAAVSIIIFGDGTKRMFNNASENNNVSTKYKSVEMNTDDKYLAKKILIVERTTKKPGQKKPTQIKFYKGSSVVVRCSSSSTVIKGSIKSITDSTLNVNDKIITLNDISNIGPSKPTIVPIIGAALTLASVILLVENENSGIIDSQFFMAIGTVGIIVGGMITLGGLFALATTQDFQIGQSWKLKIATTYVKKPTGW